jgi:serine/threonine protein kinase
VIGTTLSRYQIVEKIGAGGMGEIYRARDTELDRDVAIKVLPEAVADDEVRLERFRREAKAVAKLDHPNILAIHDFGAEGGITFAVTELLEGQTLRERVPTSGLPWQKVAEIGAAIADGLAAAHGKGIVHRDLKPENVFVTSDGRIKILGFGLAAIREEVLSEAETGTLTPEGTRTGTVMGTLGYMSPEQLRGKPADSRSDIFALGCVLYEMVSGRRAFAGGTTAEIIASILKEEPQQLSSTGATLPADLEATIHRCLEKSPEARFQSAADLAFALRSIGTGPAVAMATPTGEVKPKPARKSWWVAAVAAAALAAVVAGWLWLDPFASKLPPPTATMFTTFPGNESDPAFSPDGSMIAFTHGTEDGLFDLYVKMVGGGDPVLLDHGSLWYHTPCWSPDGRQIAFVRCDKGDGQRRSCSVKVRPALGGTAPGSHRCAVVVGPHGQVRLSDRGGQPVRTHRRLQPVRQQRRPRGGRVRRTRLRRDQPTLEETDSLPASAQRSNRPGCDLLRTRGPGPLEAYPLSLPGLGDGADVVEKRVLAARAEAIMRNARNTPSGWRPHGMLRRSLSNKAVSFV